MDKTRRNFLKVAGISTIAGFGGTAVIDRLVAGAHVAHASGAQGTGSGPVADGNGHEGSAATSGNRYGMLVDLRKFRGIVIMDYHRCIGCRFCMAACPYGSRSFNWRNPEAFVKELNKDYPRRTRGVVEKCNFCAERVGMGRQPACVEACGESKAMVFGNLLDPNSEIRKMLRENHTIQRNTSLGTIPSVFYIV